MSVRHVRTFAPATLLLVASLIPRLAHAEDAGESAGPMDGARSSADPSEASAAANASVPDDGVDAALRLADTTSATPAALATASGRAVGNAVSNATADGTGSALDLANASDTSAATSTSAAATVRPWKLSVENAVRLSDYQNAGGSARNQVSLDVQYARSLVPSLNVNFSMRFDRFDPLSSKAAPSRSESLIREAYVSWRASPLQVVDVGRVNQRVGAGFGYNPTDFFKAGAVNLDVSPDPQSRRTNRLGSVAVRGQQLWDTGSLSLMLSPRLTRYSAPGDPSASSALQRTNGVNRWMLVGSQRLSETVQPQWLIYGEQGQASQFGVNFSALFGNSIVAYAEWAGGRRQSILARTTGVDDRAFRASSAVGATWTLPNDLSLTAEFQGNGAGASATQWSALQASNPAAWGRAVQTVTASQELPARHGVFLMANWRNVGVRRLDLSGFVQSDVGAGRQFWVELRRRFSRFDVALQWQRQTGASWNRFGAMPEQRSVQLVGTFYE
ncbi:hypothetical protein P3T23_001468 [Paraburkholderia sp. GAS448]